MESLTELEQALAEASHDEAREAQLRRLLLESELYVLGEQGDETGTGRRELQLVHHEFQGATYLSAYTSLARVESVAAGAPYLVLRGAAVLEAVRPGVQLVLNVGSWPSRAFTYEEARRLVAAGPSPVREPERYPAPLLEALWAHFHRVEGVLEAHMAELDEGGVSHLLIAFRVARPELAARVAAEAEEVAKAVHDAEVRLHHLGPDELSERIREAGVCFFDRTQFAAGSPGLVPS